MRSLSFYEDVSGLKKGFWRSTLLLSVIAVVVISLTAIFASYAIRTSIFKTESVRIIKNNLEHGLQFNLDELSDSPQKHKDVISQIIYLAKSFDLIEVKIWTEDMRTVYAYSDKKSVGQYFKDDDELRNSIDKDKITLALDDGQAFEQSTLGKLHKPLLEMYVPIHWNGRVHGIMEVYRLAPGLALTGRVNLYVGFVVLLLGVMFNMLISTKFRLAMNTILEYQKYLHRANLRIAKSYHQSVVSLAKALEMRDKETEGHCERVVNMSIYIGQKMGLDSMSLGKLAIGAYLHDVGKIGVPDNILLKPGRLTPDERTVIETHVKKGFDIIKEVPFLRYAEDVVRYHHEKYNGKGYPYGLKGEEIPMVARIFALVDVFDALISKRPYKDPMPLDQILEIIRQERGEHFCPEVCDIVLGMSREELLGINRNVHNDGITGIVNQAVVGLIAEEAKQQAVTGTSAPA